MLTTAPHLQTRRPSPTTIEYTVSTHPAPTLSFHLLLLTTLLFRLLLGLGALLFLQSAWQLSSYSTPLQLSSAAPPLLTIAFLTRLFTIIHLSPLGALSTRIAAAVPTPLVLLLCMVTLYAIFLRLHTTESLLVLRGLGIQTSTSSGTYLSVATTRFIPTEKIRDVLVNEAFRGFEVRYFLVVVVEGEENVVVVFPKLLPRRRIVEAVWRGARGCLYEPAKGVEREKGEEKSSGR